MLYVPWPPTPIQPITIRSLGLTVPALPNALDGATNGKAQALAPAATVRRKNARRVIDCLVIAILLKPSLLMSPHHTPRLPPRQGRPLGHAFPIYRPPHSLYFNVTTVNHESGVLPCNAVNIKLLHVNFA